MKAAAAALTPAGWGAVWLVCRDCAKRSSGPAGVKSKKVAALLKASSRDLKPRPRVVTTACLGICPRRAMVVAVAGAVGQSQIARIASLDDVPALYAQWQDRELIGERTCASVDVIDESGLRCHAADSTGT